MIIDATIGDLKFITEHLREQDITELSVTRPSTADLAQLVFDAHASAVCKVALADDGVPALAFGAKFTAKRQVQVFGFGTDRAQEIMHRVTKYVRQIMIPALVRSRVFVGRALVHPKNESSKRWLSYLGFKCEATFRDVGPRNEEMLLYVYRPRGHGKARERRAA